MSEVETPPAVRNALLVPAAIIIGGFIIAVGIYIVRSNQPTTASLGSPSAVLPVDPEVDHITGNPTAPVILIEYSDLDCEYCTGFSQTMTQLMTEYAPAGRAAWVYRHFPVIDKNPNSAKHAAAAECAAKLGGSRTFWSFMDAMHALAPYGHFNPDDYTKLLPQFGLDATAFNQCLTNPDITARIQRDFNNALATGADGAPYSILLVKGKPPVSISGSIPYDEMKKILSDAVSKAPE